MCGSSALWLVQEMVQLWFAIEFQNQKHSAVNQVTENTLENVLD